MHEAASAAIGRGHRHQPVTPRTGGPAGNATLTAWLGVVLLIALLAELVTLLDVTGLLAWHAGLGTVIAALVVTKALVTTWRMTRYHSGARPYRTAGPPPRVFRILGPLVIGSGLALVGTGFALLALGGRDSHTVLLQALGQRVDVVTLHQAAFIVFATLVGLHVLGRLVPAVTRVTASRHEHVPGRTLRAAVLLTTATAAVVGVALVLPLAAGW